jgi:hypothetical protein
MTAARLSLINYDHTDQDRPLGERLTSLHELAVLGEHFVVGLQQRDKDFTCDGMGHDILVDMDILSQVSLLALGLENDFKEGRVKVALEAVK